MPSSRALALPILLIAGGALQVLGELVSIAAAGDASALWALSNSAIGVAFVLIAAGVARDNLTRIGAIVAAVGWFLLAVFSILSFGLAFTLGLIGAIGGTLVAGIALFRSGPMASGVRAALFAACLVGALDLLLVLLDVPAQLLKVPVVLAFGALLVVTGVLLVRGRGSGAAR